MPATDPEKWILARLAAVAGEAEAHFASYRFDLLAQCLYEFAWNEFCDWFVELAKPALNGDDAAAAASTRHTLLFVLERLLRLLHPLVPFVTEELWRQVAPRLGIDAGTIMLQAYPRAEDFEVADFVTEELWRQVAPRLGIDPGTIMLQAYPRAADFEVAGFAAAGADVEWLKAMVSALRRVRSELGVSPAKAVVLLIRGGDARDAGRLARFGPQLRFLNRLERIEAIEGEPPPAAASLVGELKLFVPLEGLVDLDAERARLDKEIARVSAEREKSEAKLAKFSDKVPAAVVEQERQRLADWSAQHDALAAQRARL